MKYEKLKLKNQLCHPLYSSNNALMRAYQPFLKPLGLTYPQYLVMLALWEKDAVNMKDISDRTFFDSGTLSPLVSKMQKKGVLKITPHLDDRRNKIITLSEKGRKLSTKASIIPERLPCVINLSEGEIQLLKKLTEKMHHNLTMTLRKRVEFT